MDLYDRLRVSSTATQLEVDRAYHKMIKEADYDASINKKEVDEAYKTLGDPTKRALYDAALQEEGKRVYAVKKKTVKAAEIVAAYKRRILWLTGIAAVLLLVTATFLFFRFGYLLKSFEAGDKVYTKTGQYYGKVVRMEKAHVFAADSKKDAYLLDTTYGPVWFPADQMKLIMVKH